MTDKIILGSANFDIPYGILNPDSCLPLSEVEMVLRVAHQYKISAIDTAFGYGDAIGVVSRVLSQQPTYKPQIINKFSLKEDYVKILEKLKLTKEKLGIPYFQALLIHDPHNLPHANAKLLRKFVEQALSQDLIKEFGISAYSTEEVEKVHEVVPVQVVQAPVNIFNQAFLNKKFSDFLNNENVSLHGRSLFLQGILLADQLPTKLLPIQSHWENYRSSVQKLSCTSLEFLMAWANQQQQVSKWVIGVSSAQDLQDILEAADKASNIPYSMDFSSFIDLQHPLFDPRNWLTS